MRGDFHGERTRLGGVELTSAAMGLGSEMGILANKWRGEGEACRGIAVDGFMVNDVLCRTCAVLTFLAMGHDVIRKRRRADGS
jgi:hypothetical protein